MCVCANDGKAYHRIVNHKRQSQDTSATTIMYGAYLSLIFDGIFKHYYCHLLCDYRHSYGSLSTHTHTYFVFHFFFHFPFGSLVSVMLGRMHFSLPFFLFKNVQQSTYRTKSIFSLSFFPNFLRRLEEIHYTEVWDSLKRDVFSTEKSIPPQVWDLEFGTIYHKFGHFFLFNFPSINSPMIFK